MNSLKDQITEKIPALMMGDKLINALANYPKYDKDIIRESKELRMIALADVYDIYIPSIMTSEIYSKLYMGMLQSLNKKTTTTATQQRNENYQMIQKKIGNGIMGGSDSFSIIGPSGIGKSSAIYSSLKLLRYDKPIITKEPYTVIVPALIVQCPHDCSVKGLLLEILRQIDITIDSDYYAESLRRSYTIDILIGVVSQVCLNHIGILIIDEIQNVVNDRCWQPLLITHKRSGLGTRERGNSLDDRRREHKPL